jgi:NADPH2:quinone reductase
MKAAVLTDAEIAVRDLPAPRPKPHEVLVRVRACSLNRADLILASGRSHGSQGGPGTVPGLECELQ